MKRSQQRVDLRAQRVAWPPNAATMAEIGIGGGALAAGGGQ
jgi:hypothetical protein